MKSDTNSPLARKKLVRKYSTMMLAFVMLFTLVGCKNSDDVEKAFKPYTHTEQDAVSDIKSDANSSKEFDSAAGSSSENDDSISSDKSDKAMHQDVEHEKLEDLKKELVDVMEKEHPDVDMSFAIRNLDTGAYVAYNNKKMNSASVIKLFILETVYRAVENGEYELDEKRRSDLEIMITESSNSASNNFIDDFGGINKNRKVEETNGINKYIRSGGYLYTELNRKMNDVTPPEGPTGYENYTCVEDVCKFLQGIYSKTLLKEPHNTETLELLKAQTRRTKIPAKITQKYPDIIVANKTGEIAEVENDVALIMCDDFNLIFAVRLF